MPQIKARAIIVDDEAPVRDVLSALLRREGFDAVAAAGGEEASRILRKGKFDIAFTDLMMPGMNGVDTVAALKSIDPEIEVIVMTGHATMDSAIACMRAGAYDYIQKPFRITDLRPLLERALDKSVLMGIVGLYTASRGILATLEQSDLVSTAVNMATAILRVDCVGLALKEPAGSWRCDLSMGSVPEASACVEQIARNAIAFDGPMSFPPAEGVSDMTALHAAGFGFAVVYPLEVRGETLGALVLLRKKDAIAFSATEIRRSEIFASEMTVALDNARLYSEVQARMRDLVATREQLLISEKLAAAGRLAAGVAHEINTPIQFVGDSVHFLQTAFGDLLGLVGRYRMLREAVSVGPVPETMAAEIAAAEQAADIEYLGEQVPKAIERTLEGTARVAEIVRSMKEFAHPDRKEKAPADINRAIQSTLTVARNEVKYVADVETDLGELPPVVCHLGDLNQVILNLLVNASHAIGDVMKVSGRKGRITIRSKREGDRVCISITDTGGGIPDSIKAKVFEPFFTTKEVGRGPARASPSPEPSSSKSMEDR